MLEDITKQAMSEQKASVSTTSEKKSITRRDALKRTAAMLVGLAVAPAALSAAVSSGEPKAPLLPRSPEPASDPSQSAEKVDSALVLDMFRLSTESGELLVPGIKLDFGKLGLIGTPDPELYLAVYQDGTKVSELYLPDIHALVNLRRKLDIKDAKPGEVSLPVTSDPAMIDRLKQAEVTYLSPESAPAFKDGAVLVAVGASGDKSIRVDSDTGTWLVEYGTNYNQHYDQLTGFVGHINMGRG